MSENDFSYASLSNLPELEQLYQTYLKDPNRIDLSWRHFFDGMAFAQSSMPTIPSSQRKESPDLRVYLLIDAYRKFGHLMATFNPIATSRIEEPEELNIEKLNFKKEELNAPFPTAGFLKTPDAPLKDLIDVFKKTYCGTVGIEYMGLGNVELEKWIQQEIEPLFPLHLSQEEKIEILHNLNKAELFEVFLHTKYVGQKRFSLEGGETMIPMLSAIIERGAQLDLCEVVLGMAHRGRLNVLANILNKSYEQIFHEFEDHYSPDLTEGTGDVKYHKGFIGALPTRSGKAVTVTLVANPSHLESVDPVVEGITRAKQELKRDKLQRQEIVPILIHGDAAVAGQGVVYETMQLSRLNGYATGGTIHLVINNQIGFTALPKETRSTAYCSDIAKAFGAPVFHVNAEDPEGCVRVAKLSIELRQKFHCDVFIDLNCYRKYGHNESDEPTFTQPLEYGLIKSKRTIKEIFCDRLIQQQILDRPKAEELENGFKQSLQKALETLSAIGAEKGAPLEKKEAPDTAVSSVKRAFDAQKLISLAEQMCTVPKEFQVHPKIQRLLQDRLAMVHTDPNKASIDWGMGELLAYATLLDEKVHIRISGQDVRRGTFSHRHATWVDQVKEQKYFPLSHLNSEQAPFDIFNSPLSEFAVLGFDFGYSVAYPKSLVIWEAQFGDFANGAQVIIDQFIASSEQKWSLRANLTLLLPHGYEGQGPEHSSGRMERFLQLAAHENMRIANCSTPAQLFHLLRAQAFHPAKKPLVVFTPKGLLRHPDCVSSLNDFTNLSFQEVIDDSSSLQNPRKILFCSGRIFYDLVAERQKRGISDIALVRIEQLYPFPENRVKQILQKYNGRGKVGWIQEEHSNMGAWEYIHPFFNQLLGAKEGLEYIGRDRSASPAAGSRALHKKQLDEIMQTAFEKEMS
ncbi:MAG: 2-oxoglutarate dehydrogenase E1 component [Rhabdochlamydiaceae bacterium]